jgi:hypothetical protein
MPDLAFRSRSAEGLSAPEISLRATLSSSSNVAARLGAGAILWLAGLGIAAAATIAAFFGTAFSLMIEHPVGRAASAPPRVLIAANSPGIARNPASAPPTSPARDQGPGSPPPVKAAGTAAWRVGEARPGPRSPSAPAAATMASLVAAIAAAGTQPEAPAPRSAANAAVASSPVPTIPAERHRDATVAPAATPTPQERAASSANAKGGAATNQATAGAPLPAAEIRALLTQGDAAFRRGDLTSARLLYRRAFEAGDGHGALGIGASYDPLFLGWFRLWTQPSDPDRARAWYLRARDLGSPEAAGRLDRLEPKSIR